MRYMHEFTLMALLVSAIGCESKPATPGPTATGPTPTLPTLPAVPPTTPTLPVIPTTSPPIVEAPVVPPPAETEEIKAQVGVGKKGRSLDEYKDGVETVFTPVTAVKSLFAAQERIVFEIQIPQAMNLFQASEGRFPKNHDEFMEKIIGFNQIPLPKLPEGHRYKYDAETHELMVERPKLNAQPPK